jgi:hypothetical protein
MFHENHDSSQEYVYEVVCGTIVNPNTLISVVALPFGVRIFGLGHQAVEVAGSQTRVYVA